MYLRQGQSKSSSRWPVGLDHNWDLGHDLVITQVNKRLIAYGHSPRNAESYPRKNYITGNTALIRLSDDPDWSVSGIRIMNREHSQKVTRVFAVEIFKIHRDLYTALRVTLFANARQTRPFTKHSPFSPDYDHAHRRFRKNINLLHSTVR